MTLTPYISLLYFKIGVREGKKTELDCCHEDGNEFSAQITDLSEKGSVVATRRVFLKNTPRLTSQSTLPSLESTLL